MRRGCFVALLSLTAAGSTAQDEASLPLPKPGLWEVRTQLVTAAGPVDSTVKVCMGAETDETWLFKSMAAGNCDWFRIGKTETGYEMESTCKSPSSLGGTTAIETKGIITGDITTSYKAEMTSRTSGLPGSLAPVVTDSVTEGRWVGACAPGQKPGDVIMPDGKIIHVPPPAAAQAPAQPPR